MYHRWEAEKTEGTAPGRQRWSQVHLLAMPQVVSIKAEDDPSQRPVVAAQEQHFFGPNAAQFGVLVDDLLDVRARESAGSPRAARAAPRALSRERLVARQCCLYPIHIAINEHH